MIHSSRDTVIDANQAACRLFHTSKEEMLGKSMTTMGGISHCSLSTHIIEEIISKSETSFEWTLECRDGSSLVIRSQVHNIKKNGTSVLVSFLHDKGAMNARKKELIEEEIEFHFLADNIKDVIYKIMLLPEFSITYLSRAAADIFNVPTRIIMARPDVILNGLDPRDMVWIKGLIDNYPNDPTRLFDLDRPLILRFNRLGGSRFFLELRSSPILDDLGRLVGLEGIARDVTDRMLAEEALKESEEKFRKIFNNTGDAIFIHYPGEPYFDVNDAAVARFGYSREELLKKFPQDLDAPEYAEKVPSNLEKLLRNGSATFRTVNLSKNGERIPSEINARMITWNGRPAFIVVMRDHDRSYQGRRERGER